MKLIRRVLFAVLLAVGLFMVLIRLPDAQRALFGDSWGNWLLAIEATLLGASYYLAIVAKRKQLEPRLRKAGAWLLFSCVLGFIAWFQGPDQRFYRAIDRYYDQKLAADNYSGHQAAGTDTWEKTPGGGGELVHRPPDPPEISGLVRDRQERELTARELELRAAEVRYKKGAAREATQELSIWFGLACIAALGLAVAEFFGSSRGRVVFSHNTVGRADG